MQASQAPRPSYSYTNFYKDCALYPEQPKFRRFAAYWAKKLYDDTEELVKGEKELSNAIAGFRESRGQGPLSVLDCPRSLIQGNDGLKKQWSDFEQLLRTYTQDLCLSQQLFKLDDHAPYFSKRMSEYSNLFQNGDFDLTDEKGAAAAYQDPHARDFVAWVGIDGSDFLTNFCVQHIEWIEKEVLQRLRGLFYLGRMRPGSTKDPVRLDTIIRTIDALTCIFAPLLLTSTMFILSLIHHPKLRISVVGLLGLAFCASAKLISGHISRGEVFAYTAAYFAVASVFVSSTVIDIRSVF